MQLRRVQQTGGSSLTVTLPKAWADKTALKAGDMVGFLEQPDGSLALQPHARGERTLQKYRIEVEDDAGEYVFRKIVASYLMGHDVIVVASKRPLSADARIHVRRAVGRIMGLEVVEETPESITLQDFLDPREFHMDKALRRMALLTKAMQGEALTAIERPSDEAVMSVRQRDDEVDRLYWLINKQFHGILRDAAYAARMEITAGQALNLLLVARLLERTADHALRIAEQARLLAGAKVPAPLMARLGKQGQRAADLFQQAIQTFTKPDARSADDIIGQAKSFQDAQERLLKDVTALAGDPVAHIAFILESVSRTAAYAADVAEVAINHRVASSS